jgi:hypothetical protein
VLVDFIGFRCDICIAFFIVSIFSLYIYIFFVLQNVQDDKEVEMRMLNDQIYTLTELLRDSEEKLKELYVLF